MLSLVPMGCPTKISPSACNLFGIFKESITCLKSGSVCSGDRVPLKSGQLLLSKHLDASRVSVGALCKSRDAESINDLIHVISLRLAKNY